MCEWVGGLFVLSFYISFMCTYSCFAVLPCSCPELNTLSCRAPLPALCTLEPHNAFQANLSKMVVTWPIPSIGVSMPNSKRGGLPLLVSLIHYVALVNSRLGARQEHVTMQAKIQWACHRQTCDRRSCSLSGPNAATHLCLVPTCTKR